ncbi:lipopolysaccharide biosynthesis protein, partial [Halobacillus trueperi]
MNALVKKFLSFSYGKWIGLIISFLLTPIITRILDPTQLGIASMFTLALELLLVISLLGTDQAYVRFYYEEIEQNRHVLLKKSLKISFFTYSIVTILIIMFRETVSVFMLGEYSPEIIFLLVVCLSFNILYKFGSLSIRMQQKGTFYSILEIFNKLINFSMVILLFYIIGAKYEIMIYSTCITFATLSLLSIFLDRKSWIKMRVTNIINMHSKKEMMKYGFPIMLTTLIGMLFQVVDRIALKELGDFSQLGLYVAAFKIIALLNIIQTSFSVFWVPVALESYEKKTDNKSFLKKAYSVVSFIMFILALIIIASKDLIGLLLGSSFSGAAMLMPFLVFIPIMRTISEVTVMGITFKKRVKLNLIIDAATLLLNVIGNILLIPIIGAKGAAVSTGISYILFFTLRTIISERLYKVVYNLKLTYLIIIILLLYAFY